MKKIALILALVTVLFCSCAHAPETPAAGTETESGAPPATDIASTDTETADTERQTEPAETGPSVTVDAAKDAEAYGYITAKAENDLRFSFVKAYIDGDGMAMLRTLTAVDYFPEIADRYADWIQAFEDFRESFGITGYEASESKYGDEYGAQYDSVLFRFSVYESKNENVLCGTYEMHVIVSELDGTVFVKNVNISNKNAAIESLIPSDARLLWWAIPCYDTISQGYTDEWCRDMVIMDTIFLTVADHDYTNGTPGMTADQVVAAAKELFGVSTFSLTDAALYVGADDGLYHVGGHGGISGYYELLYAEKDGDGYIVRMRLYADEAYLVPSDEYEIRIKPSNGLYDWVFDYVKLLKTGEVSPFFRQT